MPSLRDIVITIPTKRLPPLRTLESFTIPQRMQVLVVADPSVVDAHRRWVRRQHISRIRVINGATGLAPQVMACYRAARYFEYRYFFRLDDDLPETTFIRHDRSHPSLEEAIDWAGACIEATGTSLAGFCNTSRVDWIAAKENYGRSYALVHGGAQLCRAYPPERFLREDLPRYEDVWRSLSHRRLDGAVGRVKHVGLNKMPSQQGAIGGSSIQISEKHRKKAIRMILREFPGYIRYLGEKSVAGGKITYPKFQYLRHKGFRA
jgi:hypothetical protein